MLRLLILILKPNMQAKRLTKNREGFSLTEVIIGIMILTVAIVAATSLLVGLINSNKDNMKTVQAYYLAQEGIEAVRNVRDSNWLHNSDWLGNSFGAFADAPWNGHFESGNSYDLQLKDDGWRQGAESIAVGNLNALTPVAPWGVINNGAKIYDNENYLISGLSGNNKDTGFKREITFKDYACESDDGDWCPAEAVLVESKVSWNEGEREVVLSEVMTDWKGGAL